MVTDPIADLLTRIRNGIQRQHEFVEVPASRIKLEIARVLKQKGFIRDVKVREGKPVELLRIELRYLDDGQNVINGLQRISRPGRRVYVGKDGIPLVKGGIGVAILSTSKGIMTDQESRRQKIGGELLCKVW